MSYYFFIATVGSQTAITIDKKGSNLPPRKLGRWQFVRELYMLDVVRGTTPADITASIERNGYWLSVALG